jgi:hypothetical protein
MADLEHRDELSVKVKTALAAWLQTRQFDVTRPI